MPLDILYQQELFEAFSSGDASSLTEILDVERAFLFDFILRMTGDVNLSKETVEDTYKKILSTESDWESLAQIRFEVYSCARSMHPNRWNADVSKLQHPSLISIIKDPRTDKREKIKAQAYSKLNTAIGQHQALGREILLLHVRSKFTLSEIGKLIGISREESEQEYGQSIRFLRSQVPNLPNDPRKVISTLSNHPLPREEGGETTDLSGLIGGIQKRDTGHSLMTLFYWVLTFFILVLLISLVILLLRPDLLKQLLIHAEKWIISIKILLS